MKILKTRALPSALMMAFCLPALAASMGNDMMVVAPATEGVKAFADDVRVTMASRTDCVAVMTAPETPSTSGLPYCVLTWTSLPPGLKQSTTENIPLLTGKIAGVGDFTADYQLSIGGTLYETGYAGVSTVMPSPLVDIRGPKLVSAGVAAKFIAAIKDRRVPPDMTTIRGEWTLPDGKKVPGLELNWTPTEADFDSASHRSHLRFTAWVDGYADESMASKDSSIGVNNLWPSFVLDKKTDGTIAPFKTRLKLSIPPADKDLIGQFNSKNPLTISWSIPTESVQVKKAEKFDAEFSVLHGGSYPVTVTVSDSKGRTSTLNTVIDALEPAPFDLSWEVKKSNAFGRRPVDVRLEPTIVGGHPKDRLTQFSYTIDGAPVKGNNSKVRTMFNEAGTHEVKLDAVSKFGYAISKSMTIDVLPNKLPVCTMNYDYTSINRAGDRSILVMMSCNDEDGRIKGYSWTVDGAAKSNSANGYRYTYNIKECSQDPQVGCPTTATFNVAVKDDSGDTAHYSYEIERLYTQCSTQSDGRCHVGGQNNSTPVNGTTSAGLQN